MAEFQNDRVILSWREGVALCVVLALIAGALGGLGLLIWIVGAIVWRMVA